MKFIKCYNPPVNEMHLADSILVPEDKVYEHTKELYMNARLNPKKLEKFIKNFKSNNKLLKGKKDGNSY